MRSGFRNPLITLIAALAVVLGAAGGAEAAWVTIKNDTGKTIVIQETIVVNGQVKKGRPTNLLPGETIREFLPGPTVKKIEVLNAQNQSLWSGNLECKDETELFSVSVVGGKVTITPVANPPVRPKR
jgi:hypothetical protein